MTFDQYIQNAMGIKNAVISNREMYRTMYTEKLNKILASCPLPSAVDMVK